MTEQLSTILSHVACFKGDFSCQIYSVMKITYACVLGPLEQLELVHGAIARLEQLIMAQGNSDANCTSHGQYQSICEYPFIINDLEVIILKGLPSITTFSVRQWQ